MKIHWEPFFATGLQAADNRDGHFTEHHPADPSLHELSHPLG